MNSTREMINSILAEKKFSDVITPDMSLSEDLGFDSLSLVELIVDLENRFDIEIDESDLDPGHIKTVGQIYLLVDKYLEEEYAVRVYKATNA